MAKNGTSSPFLKTENELFTKYSKVMKATYVLLAFVWLNSAYLYFKDLDVPNESLNYVLTIARIVVVIQLALVAFIVAFKGFDTTWLLNFKIVLLILYVMINVVLLYIGEKYEIIIKHPDVVKNFSM